MDVQTESGIGQNEDLTQILPIQQKRTIALVNGFIMQTVSFLNKFAQSCESQFMELEYRMEKVEASLLILESQLSSIDGLNDEGEITINKSDNNVTQTHEVNKTSSSDNDIQEENNLTENLTLPSIDTKHEETKIKIDVSYQKFFKMVQVGVPVQAVKLKMQNEGLDPNILDMSGNIEFESQVNS